MLGDDDVWVLQAGGHTPDEVLFYLPDHQLLHTADLTLALFPAFPSSNGAVTRTMLSKCHATAGADAVRLLTDGHHHMVYRGRDEAVAFLGTLLAEHRHFQTVLRDIVETHDGLSVARIYAHVRRRIADPVVQHYLSLEFLYLPMALQQIITVSLLEMGYEAKGFPPQEAVLRPVKAAWLHQRSRLSTARGSPMTLPPASSPPVRKRQLSSSDRLVAPPHPSGRSQVRPLTPV